MKLNDIRLDDIRLKCRRRSDYIITLFVTNEISLLLTWLLVKTRISPNQITFASILCAFACSLFYAFGEFAWGSGFLFLSHLLDCTDGNLARATQNSSSLGKWLDMIGDRCSELLIFGGVALFYFRSTANPLWIALALVDGLLLSFYYYIVDISLSLGLSCSVQNIGNMKFKNVVVKWGLMEPVIYGFVLLAPLGFVKLQLLLVCLITIAGIIYQISKKMITLNRSA